MSEETENQEQSKAEEIEETEQAPEVTEPEAKPSKSKARAKAEEDQPKLTPAQKVERFNQLLSEVVTGKVYYANLQSFRHVLETEGLDDLLDSEQERTVAQYLTMPKRA
jgi:hypothetical protein